MKKTSLKIFASFYLLFYLGLIVHAAFHYHSHVSNNRFEISESTQHSKSIADPYLDENANCTLVQFSTTLYVSELELKDFTKRDFQEEDLFVNHSDLVLSSLSFVQPSLRAPPTFS